jgi:hypothetical protein
MPDLGSTFGESLPSTTGSGSVETPEQKARNDQAYIDGVKAGYQMPIPSVGEFVTGFSDLGKDAMNYGMASGGKLLQEGWTKVTDTLGSLNPFKKAAVAVPLAPSTLPKEALGTAGAIKTSTQSVDATDDSTTHKVKLVASEQDSLGDTFVNTVNYVTDPLAYKQIEFDIMPDVQEQRTVEYEPISTPQMPTEFQKYKGTKAVTWQITGVFACRTRDEARRNLMYINNLRSWSMPYFGKEQRGDKLGAPPPVLKFSGWRGLVGEVPVVMTTANWQWPKDCDWIPTGVFDEDGKEIPFPTVLNVNISVTESFSPEQVNDFDLDAFRRGRMVNAWLAADEQPHTYFASHPMRDNGGNQAVANGTAMPQADGSAVAKKPSSAGLLDKAKGAVAAGLGALTSGKGLAAAGTAALGAVAGSVSSGLSSAIAGAADQVKAYLPSASPAVQAANVNASGNAPSEAASTEAVIAQTAPAPAAAVPNTAAISAALVAAEAKRTEYFNAAAAATQTMNDQKLAVFSARQAGDTKAQLTAQKAVNNARAEAEKNTGLYEGVDDEITKLQAQLVAAQGAA